MGIVKTNALAAGSSGSGSSVGANGADLPTRLNSLSANGGNKFVTLSLGYENTDLVTGVQVNYKTGGYPVSPSDGDSMTVTGAATSIKVTGLTNKLTYYFRVFLYHEVDGITYYQTDVTNSRVTCMPRSVEITGANPKYSGTNYVAFTASVSSFKLTAPAGTKITIGGGGQDGHNKGTKANVNDGYTNYTGAPGGSGGMIYTFTLPSDVVDAACSLTIGNKVAYNSSTSNLSTTTLKIGDKTYASSSGSVQSLLTPIGYIGGKGGSGGAISYYNAIPTEAEDGEGAGGGGGSSVAYGKSYEHKAGNSPNGGGGGGSYGREGITGTPGSGWQNGAPATWKYDGVQEEYDEDTGTEYCTHFIFTGGRGGDGQSGAGGKGGTDRTGKWYDRYNDAYSVTTPDSWGSVGGGGGGAGYCGGGGGVGINVSGAGNASPGSGGGGICVIEWNA